MRAATIVRDASVARARAVLHAALPAVRAAVALDDTLDDYAALRSGTVGWEAVYAELSASEDPDGEALEKAAREAQDAAQALITAVTTLCGTGAEKTQALTGGT